MLPCLTFEVRGGRQLAKPDVGRPLDRRVRELVHKALLNWPGREAVLAETSGVLLTVMNGGAPSDCDEGEIDATSIALRAGSDSWLRVRLRAHVI